LKNSVFFVPGDESSSVLFKEFAIIAIMHTTKTAAWQIAGDQHENT
jgi:hypothetical protein